MTIKWPLAKKLLHLFFWIVITLVFLFDRRYLIQKAGLGHFAECVVVRLSLIISLSYMHLFWLIPRYFSAKKYISYFALLLLSLGVYVTLQNLYDIYLYGFVIGALSYRSFWYSFPFNFVTTTWYLAITLAFQLSLDWYRQRRQIKILQDELEREASTIVTNHADSDYVFLKSGTKKLRTPLNSIYYIQGLKDYSIIYTAEGKIIVKGSLKIVEELFPARHFLRVHKSYMVATDKIRHTQRNKLVLTNDESIPIGRSYKHLLEAG
jgi:hypothetical protein